MLNINFSSNGVKNSSRLAAVKGHPTLTETELETIFDVMNGHLFMDIPWHPYKVQLIDNLEDADALENIGEKWNVNVSTICEKLSAMTDAEIRDVVSRIETYWN